jgi:hypothetical protein
MASSPERRTVEERWGAFSGAILGITVLTAALTGSIRAVFLWGVALLTLGCIYVFARTFVPLRALEATLFGFYRDWKRSRNPYWSGFMRSRGLPSTARGNVVYLCRATFIPENSTECPKAPDLKLRCEMNKFFHREKALCTDRWDTLGMLSFMVVPSRFIRLSPLEWCNSAGVLLDVGPSCHLALAMATTGGNSVWVLSNSIDSFER